FYIGPGANAQCTASELQEEIQSKGFHRVEGAPFAAWTVRKDNAGAIAAAFGNDIPLFNPSGNSEIYPANIVMRIPRDEAPVDVPYTKWLLNWVPPYSD